MQTDDNSISPLFEDMLKKGLISTGSSWIEKAIEQKNPRFTLGIANSKLLVYDKLDIRLLNHINTN